VVDILGLVAAEVVQVVAPGDDEAGRARAVHLKREAKGTVGAHGVVEGDLEGVPERSVALALEAVEDRRKEGDLIGDGGDDDVQVPELSAGDGTIGEPRALCRVVGPTLSKTQLLSSLLPQLAMSYIDQLAPAQIV
jgi:hypothetical protein